MQLLIILALLLYGGGNANKMLSEVKPVLESIGGDEMREALKSAEEISTVLTAVQGLASNAAEEQPPVRQAEEEQTAIKFPLAPVSAIADKDITYSLSQYISQN